MSNLQVKYRVIRELVAVIGTVELVLGVYVGFLFGVQEGLRAWLFVCLLAILAYSSTRLWIWMLEKMVSKNGNK